jgi:hypothetical protein
MSERDGVHRSRLALWAWIIMLSILVQLGSCVRYNMRQEIRDLQHRVGQLESATTEK